MREIKFRGKDIFNKRWFYGSLAKDESQKQYYIIDNQNGSGIDVLEKTIGQYAGLRDKNGKEIYEGDIIHINDGFFEEFNYLIEWNKEYLRYYLYSIDKKKLNKLGGILEAHLGSMINKIEVIGNIYENKELLNT